MFKLPTHLEGLIPPPSQQLPQGQPWRGSLYLPAASPSPRGSHQELRCTAAETGGDKSSQVEIWPPAFSVQLLTQRPVLVQFLEWLKSHHPPMCMFMADRLPDPAAQRANQSTFETLVAALVQSQSVAILPWNVPDRIPGAGIVLFPTGTSRNLLVGALFLNTNFPEFIASANVLPRSVPFSPTSGNSPYDPAPPNIAASQRHTQASGSQSHYPA